MTAARKRALLISGAIVLVVALVAGFTSGSSEADRLDRARSEERAQRSHLRAAKVSIAAQNRALRNAYSVAAKLAKDLVEGNADVALTQNDLSIAKTAFRNTSLLLNAQNSRRDAVKSCLSGVKRALDATRANDARGATMFLRAAAPACQSAMTDPGQAAPVLAFDFADPFILRAGSAYFAFATNAAGGSVQEAHGTDLSNWELTGNALGNIPAWAVAGSIWAPAALARGPVTVLYYTAREASSGRQCITVALGASPGGPFLDGSTAPLECGDTGAIDPSPFVDANGSAYLLYKTERPARIWSRPLTPDGRAFAGPAQALLSSSQHWEAGNVEAPSMLRNGATTWLFYSGNDWNGRSYAEGVARCAGPGGPCTAIAGNPVLASQGNAAGPGGGEVFSDASGGWWLAYHAYQEPLVKYPNSRLLHFARIGFGGPGGTPSLTP
jgi:Glycosyl hydrolases family 43